MKFILHILFFISLLAIVSEGSAQGYFSFGYGPSIPMGESKDYIDRTSWRSFSLEGGVFVTRNLSVGAAFSWYGSYKSYPWQTYENVNGTNITVTGLQWRYGNLYPLVAVVKYYIPLKNERFRPFAGAGLGPYFMNRRLDLSVLSFSENSTQFGFYPEIGFSFWFPLDFALSLDARYNYTVKSNDVPAQSNVAVNFGLIWKIANH